MTDLFRTKALSKYFHHSGQFFYILTDLHGDCFYINPLFLQLNGFSGTDAEGTPFSALIPVPEKKIYQSIIQQCFLQPGIPFLADFHHQLPDKTFKHIRWEFQTILNDNEEPEAVQCMGTTIREVQRQEENKEERQGECFERSKAYELSAEGVWKLELEIPARTDWPVEKIIMHCRNHGYMTECNDNMARMYGMNNAEEMIGMKMENVMNLDDPKQVDFLSSFINNGYRIANAETQEYDVNGNKLFFINNMNGIVEDGLLKRVWGTQQDITQKKKAEEQLLRSELFYKNLISDSLDGIILTDTNGNITFSSPSVENILGYRPEDIIGTNTFDYAHPDDQAAALSAFREEVQMEPQTKFIDIRLKTKYGQWLWCNVRGHNMLYNPYVGRMVIYFTDDTYRKKTEHALRESENRYRNQAMVLSNVTDVIVTADLDYKITSWNKMAEEATGICAEEAIGKDYKEVITLDYSPYSREEVADILNNAGVWRGESSFASNKTGEKRVHLHTVSLVYDEAGNKKGILVVGKDITERTKMEAKLQESESFYRNLIANSLDGIVLTDKAGRVTYCSPSALKISGYPKDELVGHLLFEFIHPEDMPVAKEAFAVEVKKGSQVNYVLLRLRHASKGWVWSMVRGHNMFNNPGINAMAIYFTDDSRRKNIEDKLRDSEQRFRDLIDNLGTGVVLQDTESQMLICNKAAYTLMGLTEDQLLGRSSFDPSWNVIHEDGTNFPGNTHPVPVAVTTRKPVRDIVMGVYRPVTKDRVWLLVNADPILNEKNEIIHVICTFTDITERKRLSQQLVEQEIQKQKQITQATIDGQEKERREIGKELHDNINQHITTTRLYLEVGEEKAAGEIKKMIQRARKELTEIFNVVRNLSQSLVPPTLGDIGLIESIKDVCNALKITHKFNVSFNHRSFTEDLLPDNMKLMLFRIFQEQINNIVRHSAADTIHIRLIADAEEAELTINDNGKGVDLSQGRKGLGLTNITNRAELFNGKVAIKTAPGKGFILVVTVPLK